MTEPRTTNHVINVELSANGTFMRRDSLWLVMVACLFLPHGDLVAWPWEDPLTQEAQKVAEAAVYDRINTCGDSYVLKVDDRDYIEIKDISVKATPAEVSSVDKANGIEWKGTMSVVATMYRTAQRLSNANVTYSEWRNGSTGVPGFSGFISFHDPTGKDRQIGFRKVNENWDFNRKDTFGLFSGLPEKRGFDCDEIRRTVEAGGTTGKAAPAISTVPPRDKKSYPYTVILERDVDITKQTPEPLGTLEKGKRYIVATDGCVVYPFPKTKQYDAYERTFCADGTMPDTNEKWSASGGSVPILGKPYGGVVLFLEGIPVFAGSEYELYPTQTTKVTMWTNRDYHPLNQPRVGKLHVGIMEMKKTEKK